MEIIAKNANCNICNREYNYYDYLAHSETCGQYKNLNNGNANSYANSNDIIMGYETDNEIDNEIDEINYRAGDSASTREFSNPNLYNSYVLNYPSATIPNTIPNPNMNGILEEQINNSINNLTHQLNNININNSISRNDLYKYSNKIYLQIPYECAICLEMHMIGTEYLIFKCGHLFCLNCSNSWFEYKPTCPLCKQDVRL